MAQVLKRCITKAVMWGEESCTLRKHLVESTWKDPVHAGLLEMAGSDGYKGFETIPLEDGAPSPFARWSPSGQRGAFVPGSQRGGPGLPPWPLGPPDLPVQSHQCHCGCSGRHPLAHSAGLPVRTRCLPPGTPVEEARVYL